jgi:hypothetical protein
MVNFEAKRIILALGGPAAFAKWYGDVDRRCVWAWGARGFPSNAYVQMSQRLRDECGIFADSSAWNQGAPRRLKRDDPGPVQQAAEP